ncbi:glycosyl hydrolase catalytic core-domain-containing protein [Flammula alnicola]|nr:glycosyl hydrolase catalytic core-domain-containing protein [Flammula alnicola]
MPKHPTLLRQSVSATHTQVTQAPNSSSSLRSVVSATSASPATSIASGSHTVSATSSATPVPATHKKNPKRGIGYAGDVPGDIINANQTNSVISWQYNWANIPPDYLATSNIPYIPMQWGGVGADSFPSDVQAQGATTILTFNEPDFVNEANMQPEDAANIWMQFIQPMKALGIRLAVPQSQLQALDDLGY